MSKNSSRPPKKQGAAQAHRCRHCGGPLQSALGEFGPFCSERCKVQDLSKWFSEGYRIAAGPAAIAPSDQQDDE